MVFHTVICAQFGNHVVKIATVAFSQVADHLVSENLSTGTGNYGKIFGI